MKPLSTIMLLLLLLIGCNNQNKNDNSGFGLSHAEQGIAFADYALRQQIKSVKQNNYSAQSIDNALAIIDTIIAYYPDSVNYLNFKGKLLLWKKEYRSYIEFCNQTLNAYSNQAGILGSIGHANYLLGDTVSAIAYYNKSIRQYDEQLLDDKKNTRLMFDRAFMFNFTVGKKEAIEELERYRKQFPEDFYLNGPIHLFYDFDKEEYFNKITKKGNGLY